MATVEAQEGGPQPIQTLPGASNMTPSNAASKVARQVDATKRTTTAQTAQQTEPSATMRRGGTDTRVEAILCS